MKNFSHFFVHQNLKTFFSDQKSSFWPESKPDSTEPCYVAGKPDLPLLLASPHSGRCYPEAFVSASRQSLDILRRGEDSFVEELAAEAHACGPALLYATFPRVFCDVNRAAWDMDPGMFDGPVPSFVRPTARAFSGLGSVPRIAAGNYAVYRGAIPFSEAAQRIKTCWFPYHQTLHDLLIKTHTTFGMALLLDLHSMPDVDATNPPDFVLGDRYGQSCQAHFVDCAETVLNNAGFRVLRNKPYAGGYITQHYGQPHNGFHVLQIEIRRSLYMHEKTYEKTQGFYMLRETLKKMTQALLNETILHLQKR